MTVETLGAGAGVAMTSLVAAAVGVFGATAVCASLPDACAKAWPASADNRTAQPAANGFNGNAVRADLVGTGVRATNIAPGLCGGTEFSNVRFKGDDAAAAKVYEGTQPLTAKDIADTAG